MGSQGRTPVGGGSKKSEDKDKKLFIGGLSYETTEESLRKYFEKWGEITDCVVMKNSETKAMRGFGFITYADAHSVDDVQENRPHSVDNRTVETKRAMPREDIGKPECKDQVNKVFLGGLKEDSTEEDVRTACEKCGVVAEQVDIIKDKTSGRPRGFAFVYFADPDHADKVYLKGPILISGRHVEVKKAVERNKMSGGGDGAGANRLGVRGGNRGTSRGGRGGSFHQGSMDRGMGMGNQSFGSGGGMYGRGAGMGSFGGGPGGFGRGRGMGGMFNQQPGFDQYGGGGAGGSGFGGGFGGGFASQEYGGGPGNYGMGGYGSGGQNFGSGYQGNFSGGPIRGGGHQQRSAPYGGAAGYGSGGQGSNFPMRRF